MSSLFVAPLPWSGPHHFCRGWQPQPHRPLLPALAPTYYLSLQQPERYFYKYNSDYAILLFKTLRWFSSDLEYDPHSSPAGPSLCRPPASCPLTAQQPPRLPAAPQTTEHIPAAETSLVLRLPSGTLLAFLFTPSLHLGFGLNFTSSNRPLAHPLPHQSWSFSQLYFSS